MNTGKSSVVVPILIIVVGVGWLLTTRNVIPGVNWIWVLGLAIAGLLVFALGGVNSMTVVVGPFLIAATIFSLLRQTGRMNIDTEMPCLFITAGVLALVARWLPVGPPPWLVEAPKPPGRNDA